MSQSVDDDQGMVAQAEENESSSSGNDSSESKVEKKAGLGRWISRLFVSLIGFAIIVAVLAYYYAQRTLEKPLSFNQQQYSINTGDSLRTFLRQLAKEGVLVETITPRLFARYQGISRQLHTGNYIFDDGSSIREVLNQVTTGKGQVTATLTLVEGSTFAEFRSKLDSIQTLDHSLASVQDKELMQSLFSSTQHPEGLFFPDSYQYRAGDTDQDLLERSYKIMQVKLAEIWEGRDPSTPLKSAYEALIMASIIEKETGLGSERPLISGVFANRIKKGMRLQTDPTVIYGLGDAFDGNLTRKHLRTDTPYNTYTRKGLPPSPICLPGLASLQAAVHPEATDALYFVAKGGGAHYFSKTLKEHNRAVRKYQLGK